MRTQPTIAAVALCACMLASPLRAAPPPSDELPNLSEIDETPAAVYQRNLACAATAAALVTRLPPTSSDTLVQKAREDASHERTFAIDAGAKMDVAAPEVDRLIAQGRDEMSARAEQAATAAQPNRYLGMRVIVCAFNHLGDAINEAKAKRAAAEAAK